MPDEISVRPLTPDGSRVRHGAAVPGNPTVSVSVLVIDEGDHLATCLESVLAAAEGAPVFEILVTVNGAPPQALHRLEGRDDIVLIRADVNLGFGGGHNWASRFARGRYLLLLNDDATVEPGWMASLVRTAESHPDAAAVGSRILYPDGRLQEAGGFLWRDGRSERLGRYLPDGTVELGVVSRVEYCSGCSLLIRREAWDAMGGFDPDFFPAYYEDADLCYRLRQRGWEILADPGSRVRHLESGSTDPTWRIFCSETNRTRFLRRWDGELSAHEPGPPPEELAAAVHRHRRQLDPRPSFLGIVRGSDLEVGLVTEEARGSSAHLWLAQPDAIAPDVRNRLGEHGIALLDGARRSLESVLEWHWDRVVEVEPSRRGRQTETAPSMALPGSGG